MPLPYKKPSAAEIRALELRHDGPVPAHMLEPQVDLPTSREALCDLLADLGAELDEARQKPLNDVPVAILSRDMATVRQAIEALPVEAYRADEFIQTSTGSYCPRMASDLQKLLDAAE